MKDDVGSMESEMNKLMSNMDEISKTTDRLEGSQTPNRERVERLVSVSRLIKRLEFIFELPQRLTQAIQMGANEAAVE
jgi:hypothetical protein